MGKPRLPGLRQIPLPGGKRVTNLMVRDQYKRYKTAEEEVNRVALRYIVRNTSLPMNVRMEAQMQLSAMPNYTRPTQIHDRCIETGYGTSIIREFRMSRVSVFFSFSFFS